MEVERVQQQGHVFYRIWSEYAKDTLAFERGELMALQRYLNEHEDEITNDTLSNQMNDEMKGM
jgi:hypothetical protein